MTTKKPRLTISLDPEMSQSLRRLSELTGNSQSSMISEMLSGSAPIFEKMIRVLEAAEVAKGAIKGRVTRGLDEAQTKFEKALGLSMVGFDELETMFLDVGKPSTKVQTPTASESAAAAAISAQPTPLSNRGVRSDPQTRKTQGKSRAYKDLLSKSEHAQKTTQKRTKKGAV